MGHQFPVVQIAGPIGYALIDEYDPALGQRLEVALIDPEVPGNVSSVDHQLEDLPAGQAGDRRDFQELHLEHHRRFVPP